MKQLLYAFSFHAGFAWLIANKLTNKKLLFHINARLSGEGDVGASLGDVYGVVESVLPQSTVTVIMNKIVE